jgi:hypothetical protein
VLRGADFKDRSHGSAQAFFQHLLSETNSSRSFRLGDPICTEFLSQRRQPQEPASAINLSRIGEGRQNLFCRLCIYDD